MTDMKSLIRKRGGIKHSFTIFKKHVQSISNNIQHTSEGLAELQERVLKSELLYGEFLKLQTTIEEISEEDAVQQQYSEREAMENDYIQSISKAKLMLSHNGEADETNTNSVRSSLVTNDHVSNVKLSRIQRRLRIVD